MLAALNKDNLGNAKDNILAGIAAIIVMLNSGYYLAVVNDSYVPLVLLIVFSVFHLIRARSFSIPTDSNAVFLLIILIGILFSTVYNLSIQNLLSGGRVAITMLCAYILLIHIDISSFINQYTKLIRTIILLSIIIFICSNIGLTSSLPIVSMGNMNYYNLIIVTQGASSTRASGIFWEPGVFASHIIFATLFDIYFTKKTISIRNIVIYIIGIFLAASSAGVLMMLLVFIGYFFRRYNLGTKRTYQFLFFVLAIIFIIFYETFFEWLAMMNPEMFSKLVETSSSTTFTRMNAPIVNLEIFWESPLFGWGFTDAATQFAVNINNSLAAQTSTSTQILAAIGISGIAYTLLCLAPLFSKKKLSYLSFVDKFIIASSIILIINKEPHIYFAITWLLLFLINSTFYKMENQENEKEF